VESGPFPWHVEGMLEALKIVGIILALCIGALVVDYGCYFQATIFTTLELDGSGKGMDANYRDPPYHPFAHPVLWLLMAIAVVPVFLLVAFNVDSELLTWVAAIAFGAFFLARYVLMRRGIS
jgi:hypothetical protein